MYSLYDLKSFAQTKCSKPTISLVMIALLAALSIFFLGRPASHIHAAVLSGPLHVSSIPYYSIKDDWDSVLTLNNTAHEPLTVSLTLYSLDGKPLQLPDVSLQEHDNVRLRLSESVALLQPGEGQFEEGSIELRFNNEDGMALAPQLTVSDHNHGLSFDMEPPMGLKSSNLESLWWSVDDKTSAQVALSNTTGDDLKVQIGIEWQGVVIPSSPISMVKHQTVLLDIAQVLKDLNISSKGIENGGLSISHSGAPGALIAQGVVLNKERRFASSLNFVDPAGQKNSVLNGSGLMLARPAAVPPYPEGSFFTPQLTLKNASKATQSATVTVNYTANGQEKAKVLPEVNLAPHEVRAVDFSRFVAGMRNVSVSGAGLKIQASGAPGTLVAALTSLDQSRKTAVDVPLVSRSERSGEGGNHPFRLDEASQSVAYLTNITQKPTRVLVAVFYRGGMFTPELMSVGPGATIAVDLLQLRNSQVKDVQQRTLPPDLSEGQVMWKPHAGEALIGRVVTVDKKNGMTSNFSCPNCCTLEPNGWIGSPNPFLGPPGSSQQMTLYEYDTYCGQFTMGPYLASGVGYIASSNTSVATVTSGGMVTFVNSGSANILWGISYYHSDNISAEDCGLTLVNTEVPCPVQSKPIVNSIQVSMESTKNIVNNQRPAAGTVSVTNTDLTFATTSTTDLLALFQSGSVQATVTATGVTPSTAASQLRWKIDRDSADTVATGTPTLSTTTGAQLSITPNTAGNFRLICFYDLNANTTFDTGEEIRVLRFAVVRATVTTGATISFIDTGGLAFTSQSASGEYSLSSNPPGGSIMLLQCKALLEGGGSGRKIGVNQVTLGNIGNLIALSAKANYSVSGMWTETTGTGGALPMLDTGNVSAGQEPTGSDSAFRTQSRSSSVNSTNGKTFTVISDDNPGFGPWKIVHPTNGHTWANTQGGYDFREFIVGFSNAFPRYYVAFAKGDWTLRVTGNNSGGTWVNNGSAVTLQGSSVRPQALTNLVSSGSPPSAEAAGVQVLGRSYATNHGASYTP